MSFQFLMIIFGIAILDSLNPSAIVMTFTQLASPKKSVIKATAYIFGIYITYYTFGLALYFLTLYFGNSFKFSFDFTELLNNPPIWAYYFQLILGIGISSYILFFYKKTPGLKSIKSEKSMNNQSILTSFLLGIVITGVELSTALPYIGAISSIYLANVGIVTTLVLLACYCFIFVLPPASIVLLFVFSHKSFQSIISTIQLFVRKYSYPIFRYSVLILGFYFIFDSLRLLLGLN